MRAAERIYLLFLLAFGGFLRFWFSDFKPVILDFDPFYHARIAETIYSEGRIPEWDPLELGGIPHYYPPGYHLLMLPGKYFAPGLDFIEIASILTAFFGVLSILLLYLLARMEFGPRVALISAALFAVTPAIIYRSGLLARPTGITIFLTILLLYSFLRLYQKKSLKNNFVLIMVALTYVFTHSSFLMALGIVWTFAVLNPKKKVITHLISVTALSFIVGLFYYHSVIPDLNFSLGFTAETTPLVTSLRFDVAAFFRLSIYNLTALPFILHGIYILLKTRFAWGILAVLSILLSFFKTSLFILSIFVLTIAIAVSLLEIFKFRVNGMKLGWVLCYVFLFLILSIEGFTLYELHGVKVNEKVDPLREFLTDLQLPPNSVVLSNDIDVGHEIAYYSNTSAFMSDMTDVKRWNKNLELYQTFFNENLSTEEVVEILLANKIDYLLIFEEGRIFPFLKKGEFKLIKRSNNVSLYSTLRE